MEFTETALAGVLVVDLAPHGDDRGFFARAFCREEMAAHGVTADVAQANISANRTAGTLRGLHFQRGAAAETKIVRCVRGAIYDVAVDLRAGSPTLGRHVGVELSAANHRALVVPEGCAHGFQTLVDDTEVHYLVSRPYTPGAEGGLRWDDPALAIPWPLALSSLSPKDAAWPAWDGQPLSS